MRTTCGDHEAFSLGGTLRIRLAITGGARVAHVWLPALPDGGVAP